MTTTLEELKGKKLSSLKPKDQVKALLEQNRGAIRQALPKHINPERLLRVAQTAVTSTPGLLECYVPSLIGGIMQCGQMGLEPNNVMGHAYLIPFWNSKKNRKEAQVIIGYKGLIDLARRSGQIMSIAAHAVYELDDFEFEYGLHERLSHRPVMGDRGEIIAFYAVAHMKDGGHAFEVMSRRQVENVRDKNGKGNRVWTDHFEEMGRKTVIRRLSKYLPLSIEFATGVAMDEKASDSEPQNLESALTGEYNVVGHEDVPKETVPDNVDRAGEVYDQAKHATNEEGQPIKTKDGFFRKRRTVAKKTEETKLDLTALNLNGTLEADTSVIPVGGSNLSALPAGKASDKAGHEDLLTRISNIETLDEWTPVSKLLVGLEDSPHTTLLKEESQKKWSSIMANQEL